MARLARRRRERRGRMALLNFQEEGEEEEEEEAVEGSAMQAVVEDYKRKQGQGNQCRTPGVKF